MYAIGTKQDLLRESGGKSGLEERLNKSGNKEGLEEEALHFFNNYDIRVTFQSLHEELNKPITELFMRMHDEYLVVSRGSVARGLSLGLPEHEEPSSSAQEDSSWRS